MAWNVLELFSGIGGMHYALKNSEINGKIVAAIEINPFANLTYLLNFPNSQVFNSNLDCLNADFVQCLNINCILMSPPCQPFTRNGQQKDINDSRTKAFRNFLEILPFLSNVQYILLENVVGFETSEMAKLFLETLKKCSFYFEQYILSPLQFGIPNSRSRYYCIAKKTDIVPIHECFIIKNQIPNIENQEFPYCIADIIENLSESDLEKYSLPIKTLQKYLKVLDICFSDSRRSCCFTKSYYRYAETTGSVYSYLSRLEFDNIYPALLDLSPNSEKFARISKTLRLRYFTETEVCRLMSFPDSFRFPNSISLRQRYQLLGNSLNVQVVANLIKRLSSLSVSNA